MPPKINLLNLSPRSWLTLITWRGLKSQKIVQFRMTTLIEFAHKLFLDFLRYFSIFSLLVLLLYIYWLIVMKKDRKEVVLKSQSQYRTQTYKNPNEKIKFRSS